MRPLLEGDRMPLLETVDATGAELVERLDRVDLHMVVRKLTESADGPMWSVEFAEAARVEYLRFLLMTASHPASAIVPSRIVDEFWHQHILDTRAYAQDCLAVFGFFLHHYPYFGMNGEDDAARLATCFSETHAIYEREFASAPPAAIWGRPASPAAACSTPSECSGGGGSQGGCTGRCTGS